MPNKTVNNILERLSDLETKVDQHLRDGVTVIQNIAELRTNVMWLKWLVCLIAADLLLMWFKR
jgi:hypothetical protein